MGLATKPLFQTSFRSMSIVTDVKKLRDDTGSTISDCRQALETNNGDFEKAKQWLRDQGHAYAEK